MKDEKDLQLKRAYWSGVYYALDPSDKRATREKQELWRTAEIWLAALDWVLGRATESATTFGLMDADSKEWDK